MIVLQFILKSVLAMFSSKSFIVSGLTFRSSIQFELANHMPAMQETWVLFLCQEDPLEKEMATYSSILVWRIPWTEEPGRHSPWDCKSWTRLSD